MFKSDSTNRIHRTEQRLYSDFTQQGHRNNDTQQLGGLPDHRANKPWMVRADGTPDYRLDENDYTKKEDGTASDVSNTSYNGGAFSWLAKIYKQEYMLGNDRVVKFSMRERDGFEPVGFKDPSNNVLEGVWIPMFYGSILGADTSTPKMVSLAGLQPCYNNTTDKEHTASTRRKRELATSIAQQKYNDMIARRYFCQWPIRISGKATGRSRLHTTTATSQHPEILTK